MGQALNPYLPSWEYIPDGEPHIFGDRVYVYGSHDRFNALIFCVNDYVCWSAPVDDLSDWRYEGVIYKKNQDPRNKLGIRLLFAPDVTKGKDGRYYLYYAFDLYGIMGVAVCDTPAGHYEFYGYVHYKDGTIWGRRKGDQLPFDPGVLTDEDGSVWLYSGYVRTAPILASNFHKLKTDGGVVLELEEDMLTIKQEPKLIFPRYGDDSYENHEFFEASSIRKYKDKYIFVYSSKHNHELCYAVSDRPDGDFKFGGTLVSIGDIFLNDTCVEKNGTNYLGNTHGGLLNIEDRWYIFYHRHTNRHSYSRQACAESLQLTNDGKFKQAEITSCGLNNGPLVGKGKYEARIACNLWSKDGVARYDSTNLFHKLKNHPYFTHTGRDRMDNPDQYIANMMDGAVCGFKYFDFQAAKSIIVEISGKTEGRILVSTSSDFKEICADIEIKNNSRNKIKVSGDLKLPAGVYPLYFKYVGKGKLNFHSFELI